VRVARRPTDAPAQPPAGYYTLYPRTAQPAPGAAGPSSAKAAAPAPTLIDRYALGPRVDAPAAVDAPKWEDSAAKREASLRERKAQMVLAARQYVPPRARDRALTRPQTPPRAAAAAVLSSMS
jgi:coupling of ubiquitin conjugation to ER degradation protein 1